MWDAQCEADRRDTQEEREEIGRLRNVAMEMLQEMPDAMFMAWWEQHRVGIDEAATAKSTVSTAALIDAPEDVFNEWMREDEREIDETEGMPQSNAERGDAAELRARRFAAATLYHEEPAW